MKNIWLERLIELVEKDQRSFRELSKAAGCGPNFVQQLIKDRKDPRASQLERLLQALGPGADLYVLTGLQLSNMDLEFLKTVSSLDADGRRAALTVLQKMQDIQSVQGPLRVAQDKEKPKAETSP